MYRLILCAVLLSLIPATGRAQLAIRQTVADYRQPTTYGPDDPWIRSKVFRIHTGHSGRHYNCDGEEEKRYSPYICWQTVDNTECFRNWFNVLRCDWLEVKQRIYDGSCGCAGNCGNRPRHAAPIDCCGSSNIHYGSQPIYDYGVLGFSAKTLRPENRPTMPGLMDWLGATPKATPIRRPSMSKAQMQKAVPSLTDQRALPRMVADDASTGRPMFQSNSGFDATSAESSIQLPYCKSSKAIADAGLEGQSRGYSSRVSQESTHLRRR